MAKKKKENLEKGFHSYADLQKRIKDEEDRKNGFYSIDEYMKKLKKEASEKKLKNEMRKNTERVWNQVIAEEKTKANKNLSQYATYNLGNPNEAYAIKMAGFNDKGESNYINEINKQIEESNKRKAKRAAEEQTQRNRELSQYATYNLGNPNEGYAIRMAGYNDKGESNYINEIIKQNAVKATDEWKRYSQNVANAGAPELSYVQKMIRDTPVSQEKAAKAGGADKAREQDFLAYLEKMYPVKNNPEAPSSKLMNRSYELGNYALSGAFNMPEMDPKSNARKAVDLLSNWAQGMQNKQAVKDQLTVGGMRNSVAEIREGIKNGAYDQHPNFNYHSNKGLVIDKNNWEVKARQTREAIEKLQQDIDSGVGVNAKREDALVNLNTAYANEQQIINGAGYSDEEKANAQKTLDRMTVELQEKARTFIHYNIDNMTSRRDYMNMDSMRRMVYDHMNGFESYEKAMNSLDEKGKAELNARIDEALDYVTDPNGGAGIELRNLQSQLRYADDQIKSIEQIQKNRSEYDKLMAGDITGDTTYDPSLISGSDLYKIYGTNTPEYKADRVYAMLDPNGKYYGDETEYSTMDEQDRAIFMLPEEKDKFISYYKAGQKKEAWAFYEGLMPTLNQFNRMAEDLSLQESAREFPFLTSVATVGAHIAQPVEFVRNLAGLITGDKKASDFNSENYQATRIKNTVRQQVASDLGEVGGMIYNAGMSGLDSAINAFIAGGRALPEKIVQKATLGLFSTQAFQTSLQQNLEESNGNMGYSVLNAAIDAAIETATEVWSVENLLKDPKRFAKYILKTSFSEASEEFVGAVVEPYVKEMLGQKNKWKTRADEIYNAGGYMDGKQWVAVDNIDAATRQAMREWNKEIFDSTISGGLSTGGGLFFGGAQNLAGVMDAGKAITNVNNTVNGKSGGAMLLDIAKGMAEGTESRKLADKYAKAGKEISSYQAGQLAVTMSQETDEQIANVAQGTIERLARESMIQKGLGAEDAAQVAPVLAKVVMNGGSQSELNRQEKKLLAQHKEAITTLTDFMQNKEIRQQNAKAVAEATGEQQAIRQQVNTLANGGGMISGAMTEEIVKAAQETQIATAEDLAGASGQRTNNGLDVVHEGEIRQIEGKRGDKYILNGGQEVDADSVKSVGGTLGVMMEFANRNNNILSDDGFNAIVKEIGTNGKLESGKFADEALNVYIRARIGMPAKNSVLSQESVQRINEAAREEQARLDQERIQNGQIRLERGKGTAEIDGVQYGTREFLQKLSEMKLNRNQRSDVVAVSELAVRLGRQVRFINDESQEGIFGYENGNTGVVTINLAGKDIDENGMNRNRSLMVVASHEFTHWLEQNSLDAYNELRQFVFDKLQGKGTDVARLIKRTMDDYLAAGETIDLNGAMAEIVANASDQVLGNKQVVDQIRKTSPTLYGKIKEFVKNFVKLIENAASRMAESATYESRRLREFGDEIARLWLQAEDEAQSGQKENAGNAAETGENVQFAVRQKDNKKDGTLAVGRKLNKPLQYVQDAYGSSNPITNILTPKEEYVKKKESKRLTKEEQRLNDEYMQAIKDKDLAKQQQMLEEKMAGIEGIYPFYAVHMHKHPHAGTARAIKNGSMYAVHNAAAEMAKFVPENAVLIPMPGRNGVVTDTSDTMLLAKEIGRLTGKPVLSAIEGVQRPSRFESKKKGQYGVTAEEMGFRQVKEIPEGKIPIIIDNVVAVGETAKAAMDAIKGSRVLAFTKGQTDKTIKGLKAVYATKDKMGRWIPYNKRFNMEENDWRYSVRQRDEQYMDAVESGDVLTQQALVEMAAIQAGYTDVAYHGTSTFGFTQFDLEESHGAIFVSYDEKVSKTYTWKGKVKNISDATFDEQYARMSEMDTDEFIEYAKSVLPDIVGSKLISLEHDKKTGTNRYEQKFVTTVEPKFPWTEPVQRWYRFEMEQLIWEQLNSNGEKEGIYRLYSRPGNQLVIDGQGAQWDSVPFNGITYTTREIAQWAKTRGYTSVRINDIYDQGSGNGTKEDAHGDVGIFFNEEDLKSADPVTYDNDGNVIPLSERFKPEKKDIRYSISQMRVIPWEDQVDRVYGSKAKKDDIMVLTDTGEMSVYGIDDMITVRQAVFSKATRESNGSSRSSHGISIPTMKKLKDAVLNPVAKIITGKGTVIVTDLPDQNRNYIVLPLQKKTMERNINTEDATSVYGRTIMPTLFGRFDGEQFIADKDTKIYIYKENAFDILEHGSIQSGALQSVKDAIDTLSQEKEEVNNRQFSMRQPVEMRQDGLVAIHNLTEQNLVDTLNEGGFTAPSIAIVKTRTGHSKFGEISVIFNPGAIDPMADNRNMVYGTDAWTPTRANAEIHYEIKWDKIEDALEKINEEMEDMEDYYKNEARRWLTERGYEEQTSKTLNEWADEAYNNYGMLAAYQAHHGNEIEEKTRKVKNHSELQEDMTYLYDNFLNVLESTGQLDAFMDDVKTKSGNLIIEKWARMFGLSSENAGKIVNRYEENPDSPLNKKVLLNKMTQAAMYEEDGRQILTHDETDRTETFYAMKDRTDKEGFKAWFRNLVGDAFGARGVRNDRDWYDSVGNRRTFRQTHWEPTAENIVKAMYRNHDAKGGEAGGATGLMAKGSKEYKTIGDIRSDSGRLEQLSEEEYKEKVEALDQRIKAFTENVEQTTEHSAYEIKPIMIEAAEVYAKKRTEEAFRKAMQQEGIKLTDSQMKEAMAILNDAREIPTGYFEAKPERVVGFDEIAKVILPENYTYLAEQMEARGIPYETYDGTEEDRLEKLNEDESYQFSIQQSMDMDVRRFMMGLNETDLKTAQERTLLKQYKDLNMAMDVQRLAVTEYRRELAKLQAKPNKSAWDLDRIRKIENAMNIRQAKLDRMQQDMIRVTSSEGYAGLIYRTQKLMDDMVTGRTAKEVQTTIAAIQKRIEQMDREMAEREERIRAMAGSAAARQVQALMNGKRLDDMAKTIRKAYGSSINKKYLMQEMSAIRLKMAAGENIDSDIENLAWEILNAAKSEDSSYLNMLKGSTILLSKTQYRELQAANGKLSELRKRIAGTGIRIAVSEAKEAMNSGENTLDRQWDELCDMIPALDRNTNDKDMVEALVSFIESEKRAISGAEMYGDHIEDVKDELKAYIAIVNMDKVKDPAAMKVLQKMNSLINQMAGDVEKSAEEMSQARAELAQLIEQGRLAVEMTDQVKKGMQETIRYLNNLSEQSEAAKWRSERVKLIEKMKAENTQNLLKAQEEYRQKIERSKRAKEMQDDNMALRRMINTNVQRIRKLLANETAQKNIPEHMKGIAREVLGLIVRNDLTGRKISGIQHKDLLDTERLLQAWEAQEGRFDPAQIQGLEDGVVDAMINALDEIRTGISFYNASTKGNDLLANLQGFKNALERISNGVTEISNVIQAERSISLNDRKINVIDQANKVEAETKGRRYKEWTGKAGRGIAALKKAIVTGNVTPEYFFKWLRNEGLSDLWEEYHRAENRNGLELAKAKARLSEMAEKAGYSKWDLDKRLNVQLESGNVQMTIGQLMSLYATWKREKTLGPAMSQHLERGGFYVEENDLRKGIIGRQATDKRAHRVTENDMKLVQSLLSQEQADFVDDVVGYMSNEMSQLGNEASMKAYGIKMYKEKYYFPFKMWDGIKSRKSNDSGNAAKQDRAFHPSFSKTRQHGANNAIILGDFMQTAADHIVGMINYATMGLANENLQKVLNAQVEAGTDLMDMTKRNIRTVLEEAYGQDAMRYLSKLQEQLNGGAVQVEKTLYDKAISLFRKNAVAGSLSVAAQQPLSYIRAATMINPVYLAGALNPIYYKGSLKEMRQHSGVAVIKDMGRFDMGFGQSARDYLDPTDKSTWQKISDKVTILPELMDTMTWTRMWSAVKIEQHRLHPEMDIKSEKFLDMVGERFNDVMRKTQVYDSVLTKSQNMRNQNPFVKSITSFMAEPTLSLNVLADAVQTAMHGKGKERMTAVARAAATFAASAAAQAAIKAIFSTGRSPDDKKTWEENFMYRFISNLISEADVLSMIPGYSDMVELLKNGELQDDAMGAIGKAFTAMGKAWDNLKGDLSWRNVEDGAAQVAQLFSTIPLKNIMRDMRAMYNWFLGKPYADRETSAAVLKYQKEQAWTNADTIFGAINAQLGEAGLETTNKAYYSRIYDAMRNGDQQTAEGIREYLTLGRGVKEESIDSGIRKLAKTDDSLSAEEKADVVTDTSTATGAWNYVVGLVKSGEMKPADARKRLKEVQPEKSDNDIWWAVDRAAYKAETGKDAGSGYYYRLKDALNENKVADIRTAVKQLMDHGVEKGNARTEVNTKCKKDYLAAGTLEEKNRIRNAMEIAYKELGYTKEEADKTIEKWKEK